MKRRSCSFQVRPDRVLVFRTDRKNMMFCDNQLCTRNFLFDWQYLAISWFDFFWWKYRLLMQTRNLGELEGECRGITIESHWCLHAWIRSLRNIHASAGPFPSSSAWFEHIKRWVGFVVHCAIIWRAWHFQIDIVCHQLNCPLYIDLLVTINMNSIGFCSLSPA